MLNALLFIFAPALILKLLYNGYPNLIFTIQHSKQNGALHEHILNQNGTLVAQKDNWPVNGLWPPTCWQAGEIIVDPYAIPLPADLPAGTYSLLVGLYDADTNIRLLTADGQDAYTVLNDLTLP